MEQRIRGVIAEHARLAVAVDGMGDEDDLYEAGLTSHASVNLMLALEDEFDIEFPEHMLRKQTFESIDSIRGAITELTGASS